MALIPALTVHEKSDETGMILVAYKTINNNYYVLEDYSERFEAISLWTKKVYIKNKELSLNAIVLEQNQRGDFIKSNLLKQGTMNVKTIFTKESKYTRALQLKNLYLEGKIFHTKVLKNLEEQILSFKGTGMKQDDRLNALMHAILYMEKTTKKNNKIKII